MLPIRELVVLLCKTCKGGPNSGILIPILGLLLLISKGIFVGEVRENVWGNAWNSCIMHLYMHARGFR